MATHSRMLAGRIPWAEEPGSWDYKVSDTTEHNTNILRKQAVLFVCMVCNLHKWCCAVGLVGWFPFLLNTMFARSIHVVVRVCFIAPACCVMFHTVSHHILFNWLPILNGHLAYLQHFLLQTLLQKNIPVHCSPFTLHRFPSVDTQKWDH